MFVFVAPMYSKAELNADSNYVLYAAMIRAMGRVRPDWHFVVAFPDDKSGFKYEDDGFFKAPNVSRVPQRISPRKHANAITYDGIWYDRLFRQVAFDVCWCNLVELCGNIRYAGESTYEPAGRPLVVAAHNYMIHESLPYPFEAMLNVALAQVCGSLLADWNVFNSAHCRTMFLETATKWMKPTVVEPVIARSSTIGLGTLEPTVQPPADRANREPVIAYNHRLQGYKQWRRTFELFDELYGEGHRFRVRFFLNCAENVSLITGRPYVEVVSTAGRDAYLAALRECDLNVTNSQHETFCIAAVESMAFGQPLLAPDGVTFPEITGRKETGYPYLFKTPKEQKEMLIRLLTDPAERRTWGERLSAYVRREYVQDVWAARYAELFERLTAPITLNPAEDALRFVEDVIRKNSGQTFHDYMVAVRHKEVNGRVPYSSQSFTLTKALRMARMLGAQVVMDRGAQRVYAPGAAVEARSAVAAAARRSA